MKEAEEQYSGCCPENSCIRYYRKVMHRPVFRIVVHHFMELIFLFTLSLSSIDPLDVPNKIDAQFYDYVAGVFILSYCLDDIYRIVRKGWANLSTFWTGFSIFNSLLLTTGFSIMAISYKERKD